MIAVFCVLTSLLPAFGDTTEPLKLRLEMLDGATKDVTTNDVRSGPSLYFGQGGFSTSLDQLASITALVSTEIARSDSTGQYFYLADGSEFEGKILEMPGDAMAIRVDLGLSSPVEVSFAALRGVRFRAPEKGPVEDELQDRLTHRPADKDLLIVSQDDKPVVLPGALEKLTPQNWEFTIGRKTQRQSLDSAYAVVLGGARASVSERSNIKVSVQLHSSGKVEGFITASDPRAIRLDGLVGALRVSWDQIASISVRSNLVVYLSELTPSDTKCTSILDVDFPPRRNTSITGSPLSLRGQNLARGIGAHAKSRITYRLDKQFERLLATIGIDDDAAPAGSAVFRVLGYGKVLYESPVLRREDPPKQINVPLEGAREITLECDDAGDSDVADHCDWGEVRVLALPTSTNR